MPRKGVVLAYLGIDTVGNQDLRWQKGKECTGANDVALTRAIHFG